MTETGAAVSSRTLDVYADVYADLFDDDLAVNLDAAIQVAARIPSLPCSGNPAWRRAVARPLPQTNPNDVETCQQTVKTPRQPVGPTPHVVTTLSH